MKASFNPGSVHCVCLSCSSPWWEVIQCHPCPQSEVDLIRINYYSLMRHPAAELESLRILFHSYLLRKTTKPKLSFDVFMSSACVRCELSELWNPREGVERRVKYKPLCTFSYTPGAEPKQRRRYKKWIQQIFLPQKLIFVPQVQIMPLLLSR